VSSLLGGSISRSESRSPLSPPRGVTGVKVWIGVCTSWFLAWAIAALRSSGSPTAVAGKKSATYNKKGSSTLTNGCKGVFYTHA
jgi:hypothetical protein